MSNMFIQQQTTVKPLAINSVETTNHKIEWTPGTGGIAVVRYPGPRTGLRNSTGACLADWPKGFEKRKSRVMAEIISMIVRDKCPPSAVHEALLPLKEYCDCLPADYLYQILNESKSSQSATSSGTGRPT